MANIFDKFLNSMKLYDDDDDYDDDDEMEEEEEAPAPRRARAARAEAEEAPAPRRVQEAAPQRGSSRREAAPAKRPNVVSMRGTSHSSADKSSVMDICMIRPTKLDDAREICEYLLNGRAVVINMEGVHVDLSQRIIDFTSGACFSVRGNLQKISKYIFIVSPSTIDLTGDFQENGQSASEQDVSTLSLDF